MLGQVWVVLDDPELPNPLELEPLELEPVDPLDVDPPAVGEVVDELDGVDDELVAALAATAPPSTRPPARAPTAMTLRALNLIRCTFFPCSAVGPPVFRREENEYARARCEPRHRRLRRI